MEKMDGEVRKRVVFLKKIVMMGIEVSVRNEYGGLLIIRCIINIFWRNK